MIINKPHLCTRMKIWAPKYSSQYNDYGEKVVLLSKTKVHHASPVIIIDFIKAPHLEGQRFAISRVRTESCDLGSNGKIPCYIVPMSLLESYETGAEVMRTIEEVWPS